MLHTKYTIESDMVNNGLEAVNAVEKRLESNCCKVFRLIFMDCMMPIMDGFEATKNIR